MPVEATYAGLDTEWVLSPTYVSAAPELEQEEKISPHPAGFFRDEFVPAHGSSYVPGPNPAELPSEHLLQRMYVLDSWMESLSNEGSVSNIHLGAVWNELNSVVGRMHQLLRHDRQQAFGAEYTLRSVARWYKLENHPNQSLQRLGNIVQSALRAMNTLLQQQSENEMHAAGMQMQPEWSRMSETPTQYI